MQAEIQTVNRLEPTQTRVEETMLQNLSVAVVGSGTMAEAIIKVILAKELVTPQQITASDPIAARGADLAARYGIHVTTDNAAAVSKADMIVLSVKPQTLPLVLSDLEGRIPPAAVVFSIVAGVKIATLVGGLGHAAVIRSMPNTPAQIGQGMTVWMATDGTSDAQCDQVRTILQAMGQEVRVHEEKKLDMATAVSGSGPAYVFLFMEAMVDAAVHLGFSRSVASQLVLQTVVGSALFAAQSAAHLAELRNRVTSPGGTTADALYQLEKGSLRTVMSRAIWGAYQKSRLLADVAPAANDHERAEMES
jgi:pyrroline-5-carboxylate reductase